MGANLHPERWQVERPSDVIFVPRISRRAAGGMKIIENGPFAAHTFSYVNGTTPEYTFPGIVATRSTTT